MKPNCKLKLRRHLARWSCLLLASLVLPGCWDARMINQLSITSGVALDQAPPEQMTEEGAVGRNNGNLPQNPNRLQMTFEIIIPKIASGMPSGSSTAKPFTNITVTGDTVHELTRRIALETNPIFAEHAKVILISRQLAEKVDLIRLLNMFYRDEGYRESCVIFLTESDAKSVFSVKGNDIPTDTIMSIADNQFRSTRVLPLLTIQKTMEKLTNGTSFVLQSLNVYNGKLMFHSGAVIDGATKRFTGYMGALEMQGLAWLHGKKTGGLVRIPEFEGKPSFVYEVKKMTSRIIPVVNGDQISFRVQIRSRGRISEDWRPLQITENKLDIERLLQDSRRDVEREIRLMTQKTLDLIQRKYQTDVIGCGNELRIQHPQVWAKVKPQWKRIFAEAPITVDVSVDIEDFGLENMQLQKR
ncbi:Ger(x)C family spore germination C-terminal domain-containing protein [Paenibacillus sp. MER TA 81-3]|uniref:Ger(x)C family spore germination protein n=1 Tax=Paenibacillus sp. MER TA 81-3 TaxID=2939573 RepID=UPI00204111AD|nr:Ger(x)C family spore germination protein [Paenibacillus sp. MER TA 81-3]MCM3342148.1 Ger(x)C family spore germination C-terminal domain-containing protein [Paenibacillus sp. MER TA 81-3]